MWQNESENYVGHVIDMQLNKCLLCIMKSIHIKAKGYYAIALERQGNEALFIAVLCLKYSKRTHFVCV